MVAIGCIICFVCITKFSIEHISKVELLCEYNGEYILFGLPFRDLIGFVYEMNSFHVVR